MVATLIISQKAQLPSQEETPPGGLQVIDKNTNKQRVTYEMKHKLSFLQLRVKFKSSEILLVTLKV